MKRKILIAVGLVLVLGLVAAVATAAAAEGEVTVAGWGIRHGTIVEIDGGSLVVETPRGLLNVLVDENTRYRIPGVQDPGLEDLAPGNHIAGAGRMLEEGTARARLIIRLPAREEQGLLRGELTAKGDDWLEITRPDDVAVRVLLGEETRYRIPEADEPDLDDLQIGDPVYAGGLWNQQLELQARFVGRVPEGLEHTLPGKVTAVSDPILTLHTRQGSVDVITDEGTRFQIRGAEEASLADIALDDRVVVGGAWDPEQKGFHAVVVGLAPQRAQRVLRHGIVTSIDGNTLILETRDGRALSVITDQETRFRVPGVENPGIDDIQVGYQAAAAGLVNPDDGTLQARIVGARPAPAEISD